MKKSFDFDRFLCTLVKVLVLAMLSIIAVFLLPALVRLVRAPAEEPSVHWPALDYDRPVEVVWWSGVDGYAADLVASTGIGLPGGSVELEFSTLHTGSPFRCRVSADARQARYSTDGLIIDYTALERSGQAPPPRFAHQAWIHFGLEPSAFDTALDQARALGMLFNLTMTPAPAQLLSHVQTDWQHNRLVEAIFDAPPVPYDRRLPALLLVVRPGQCWPWLRRVVEAFDYPVHVLGCPELAAGHQLPAQPVAFGEPAFDALVAHYTFALLLPAAFSCTALPVDYWHYLRLGVLPVLPDFAAKRVYEPVSDFLLTFASARRPVPAARLTAIAADGQLAERFRWKAWRDAPQLLSAVFNDRWLVPSIGTASGYVRLCQVLHYLRFDAQYQMHAARPYSCELDRVPSVLSDAANSQFAKRATDRFIELLRQPRHGTLDDIDGFIH